MFNYRSNYFSFNNRNKHCVVLKMYCWWASVEGYGFHVYLDIISFIGRLVHESNLFIIGVRGYNWLNLYFAVDRNTKESMNSTWNWPSYVENSSMIRISMVFLKILVCVVFNLIPTPCKYDNIWPIIWMIRIKDRFMRETSNILNIDIDTLENRKSWWHSLDFHTTGFVINESYTHKINFLYPSKCMSKFFIILNWWTMKSISY